MAKWKFVGLVALVKFMVVAPRTQQVLFDSMEREKRGHTHT